MSEPYGKRSKEYEAKAKILKEAGWYTYYNKDFWMHPKIEENNNGVDLGFLTRTTDNAIKCTEKWNKKDNKESQ